MNKHPVDQVYDATRAAWTRYRDMSTPWPADTEGRKRMTAHRSVINETRVRLLEQYEPDQRIKRELHTLRAHLKADADYIANN